MTRLLGVWSKGKTDMAALKKDDGTLITYQQVWCGPGLAVKGLVTATASLTEDEIDQVHDAFGYQNEHTPKLECRPKHRSVEHAYPF